MNEQIYKSITDNITIQLNKYKDLKIIFTALNILFDNPNVVIIENILYSLQSPTLNVIQNIIHKYKTYIDDNNAIKQSLEQLIPFYNDNSILFIKDEFINGNNSEIKKLANSNIKYFDYLLKDIKLIYDVEYLDILLKPNKTYDYLEYLNTLDTIDIIFNLVSKHEQYCKERFIETNINNKLLSIIYNKIIEKEYIITNNKGNITLTVEYATKYFDMDIKCCKVSMIVNTNYHKSILYKYLFVENSDKLNQVFDYNISIDPMIAFILSCLLININLKK